MRHLFILDPLDALDVTADTSIAFIQEAWRRGHRVEACGVTDLGQRDGDPFVDSVEIVAGVEGGAWYSSNCRRRDPLSAYDAVWMFAEALDKMNSSDRNELRTLRVYEQFHGLLNSSDFTGVSGQIDWFNR